MITEILSSPRLVMFLLGWIAFTIVAFIVVLQKLDRLIADPEADETDIAASEGARLFDLDYYRGDRK